MIKYISSSLSTFKSIEFHAGLNILISKKESSSSDKETRNRAGKSSLVEIIHFLLGSECRKESIFKTETLVNESFCMNYRLNGESFTIARAGHEPSKVALRKGEEELKISNTEWVDILGKDIFHLDTLKKQEKLRTPTFRSLFSYFARRNGGFTTPEKQATMQQTGDYQINLMYLLGLDWSIASEWQAVRDEEKNIKEIKKAADSGNYKSLAGKPHELRTELALKERRLDKLKHDLSEFKILAEYKDLELEANEITRLINNLSNENIVDYSFIEDITEDLNSENPPDLQDLRELYKEAGIVLPDLALKRYDEVLSFHQSVIKNRKDYLKEELLSARKRINERETHKASLEERSSQIFGILRSHGALDQYSRLQSEFFTLEADVKLLKSKFSTTEEIESRKSSLSIKRSQLEIKLRRDFTEQAPLLSEAILAFESVSEQLYASAGSMEILETNNGPQFDFPIQGKRSKGIQNMQIFCFDMMLMKLSLARGLGPGFLVHDSHLFDGVDGRQVISALQLGAKLADDLGFQYIVTMNEDDAFKEIIEGFDLTKFILPVTLTDATETGGLFGVRF